MAELSKEFLEAFDARTTRLLGKYKEHKNDERAILEWKIADVNEKLNAARVGGGGNVYRLNEELQGLHQQLLEAKMKDEEVLKAAQALASNGKDDKTKSFGKGLVDFYKKNKSFTPDQVAGLQNIMKNASFQMAKEEVEATPAKNKRPADDTSEKEPMKKIEKVEEAVQDFVHNKMSKAEVMEKYEISESDFMTLLKNSLSSIFEAKTDEVDEKEAKKDFKDRKDKDIDNDGDVDDSDEYLHKRRKAIAKDDE